MRRITRIALPQKTEASLICRQTNADRKLRSGTLEVDKEWNTARQTVTLKTALSYLKKMAGRRERCMYCCDSHGTDIEHFWPKSRFAGRMFRWENMLLCCTECGRFKQNQFPLANGRPMLVDPTACDPWEFLDFDPVTGNITARFNVGVNDWSDCGLKTVEVFHLDRREALAGGYQKTHRRLTSLMRRAIQEASPDPQALAAELRDADDHGLLGWYFSGTGQNEEPVISLRRQHPDVWNACVENLT